MPIAQLPQPIRAFALVFLLMGPLAGLAHAATPPPGVAVVRAAAWSPGDTVREGAGEFEIFVRTARLQQKYPVVGLVGVGNRHGIFVKGAERAFQHLAMCGVPVAKLSSGGDYAPDAEELAIDASGLSEEHASRVLAACLSRYGALPKAANPDRPTATEIDAIQQHLGLFREQFRFAAGQRVALR